MAWYISVLIAPNVMSDIMAYVMLDVISDVMSDVIMDVISDVIQYEMSDFVSHVILDDLCWMSLQILCQGAYWIFTILCWLLNIIPLYNELFYYFYFIFITTYQSLLSHKRPHIHQLSNTTQPQFKQ